MKQTLNYPTKTIILGAGASYSSIPIVSHMIDHLKTFSAMLEAETKLSNGRGSEFVYFSRLLKDIVVSLEYTLTPDAVLHSYYKTGNNFDDYLRAFWIYLLIIQFANREEIKLNTPESDKKLGFIDKRYGEFMSDYYMNNESDFFILSWNYDIQFELAYDFMTNKKDINSTLTELTNLAQLSSDEDFVPRVLHLNGLSGVAQKHKEEYTNFLGSLEFNMSLDEVLNKTLWILASEHKKEYSISDYVGFSFILNDEKIKLLKRRIARMTGGSRKLIFIGYSFPELNREIDAAMFDATGMGTEIIIQNPVDLESKVRRLFGLENRPIRVMDNDSDLWKFIAE